MALPTPQTTQMFSSDLQTAFRVYYWDTTYPVVKVGPRFEGSPEYLTASGGGLEFGIFDLLTSEFNPQTKQDLDNALKHPSKQSGTQTRSVLGYNGDEFKRGVIPLIYQYWGSGAPPGGSRYRQTLLKFSGYVRKGMKTRMVFGGQGTVHAYVTRSGSNSQSLVRGKVREPFPRVDFTHVNKNVVENNWGYLVSDEFTFQAGDYVEIYYWHNGENWGGIFAKLLGETPEIDDTFLDRLRQAPILGTSFMSKEEDPIPATELPYVQEVSLSRDIGAITEMEFTVAVTSEGEPDGYYLDTRGDVAELVDNADTDNRIKKGRVVHFEGAFVSPDGTEETYPRFTGRILDFYVNDDGETATVKCGGVESMLTDVMDENFPDPISYHANGFIQREGSSEPVFGIPAFDNWPLELVSTELCHRAGIDSWNLGLFEPIRRRFVTATTGETYYGKPLFTARALADTSQMVRLERNTNYGNVPPLKNPHMPDDDEYLFRSEVTRRLYDRILELVDHYGYDFHFAEDGFAVLGGRNNPTAFQYMTKDGEYAQGLSDNKQKVAASAVGGIYLYQQHSDGPWSQTIEGYFSRLDLYTGIGIDPTTSLNGGRLAVTVEVHNGTSWTVVPGYPTEISTFADTNEAFYYDNVVREDGTNATIFRLFTLPFDRYRVTLTTSGPEEGTDCVYRINGVAVYERDPEQSSYYDPSGNIRKLSTLDNILSLSPEAHFDELRNQVIVVGSRKATVTDSRKMQDNIDPNPNNPEREFHVAVAADPYSIYDPTSANFVGGKRMTLIFDDKVTDGNFAKWLTRTILHRYRLPRTSAQLEHTILPNLELRDALFVVAEKHKDVEHLLWVESFRETWSMEEATTSITVVPYPEIPSYQPREDVDIDTLFDHDGDGKGEPLINFRISYKNVFGDEVNNYDLANAPQIRGFATRDRNNMHKPMHSAPIVSGTSMTLTHPAIMSTLYLGQGVDPNEGGPRTGHPHRILKNHPYRHFYNVVWNSGIPTLHWDFQEGDGTANIYDQQYYEFPTYTVNAVPHQWRVFYDYLPKRSDWKSPFYDPYTSELGNFVSIQFDALVSGRYRISIWDATRAGGKDTPIAWLTNPGQDPLEEEQHWSYVEAGSDVEFVWDGVDNIGYWNRMQSQGHAQVLEGSFGDRGLGVGAGYYAWNDRTTNPFTLIGDDRPENFDSEGKPYFTIGQFGQFYVKVEVLNDDLVQKDRKRGEPGSPRAVQSNSLPYYRDDDPNKDSLGWHSLPPPTSGVRGQTTIWTHLGEPTQVGITIEDWRGTTPWEEGMDVSNPDLWTAPSTPDSFGSLREDKPVRFKFHPIPRRGPLFEEDPTRIGVKLTRQVHLKTTVFDQFWTLAGVPWAFSKDTKSHGVEDKRLTSRMFHNEEHTLEWADPDWRTGEDLQDFEWIFVPQYFRKDFGLGIEESLQYGDYEQLESLPGYDARERGATSKRAYLTLAFMSYLFYMSAFVLDRSGRHQWCINRYKDQQGNVRGHIDKSKIVTPDWLASTDNPANANYDTYKHRIINYEDMGADRYLIRSVFARQWREPGWGTGDYPGNPITQYSIPSGLRKFAQFPVKQLDIESSSLTTGISDPWLLNYRTANRTVNRTIRRRGASSMRNQPTLPSIGYTTFKLPDALGTWTFSRPGVENFYTPTPTKDFMPYWRYPDMPDWATARTDRFHTDNYVHILMGVSGQHVKALRDLAEFDLWQGYAFSKDYANTDPNNLEGARVGITVKDWADDRLRNKQEVHNVFNYVKQDTLDRFDQFRGVRSRSPYADRDKYDDSYAGSEGRLTTIQPVAPSGTYLLNLGKYSRYVATWIHYNASPSQWLHAVDRWTEPYDIRFRTEYVWTNDRYYPVDHNNASAYAYFKQEYTGAAAWAGPFWWQTTQVPPVHTVATRTLPQDILFAFTYHGDSRLFFDAGAWTGWKDDIPSHEWRDDPYLRWAENSTLTPGRIGNFKQNTPGAPYASGGNGWTGQDSTGPAVRQEPYGDGLLFWYRRTNILDEYASHSYQRLAVGPRVPETRDLVMNLTLPARYAGLT